MQGVDYAHMTYILFAIHGLNARWCHMHDNHLLPVRPVLRVEVMHAHTPHTSPGHRPATLLMVSLFKMFHDAKHDCFITMSSDILQK